MYTTCVLDATMPPEGECFSFLPVKGDLLEDPENAELVAGLVFIAQRPPPQWELIAIVHPAGEAAVEAFCADHEAALERLRERLEG